MKEIYNRFGIIKNDSKQELSTPASITYVDQDNGELVISDMNRESRNYVYGKLGIGFSLSRKLFDIDQDTWNDLIEKMKKRSGFNESEFSQLTYEGNIISFFDDTLKLSPGDFTLEIQRFLSNIDSFNTLTWSNSNGITNVVMTRDNSAFQSSDSKSPILMLSMDIENSWYSCHQGCIYNGKYIVFPKACYESGSFIDTVMNLDLEREYMVCERMTDNKDFTMLNMDRKLSVREVLDFIKFSGISPQFNDEGKVSVCNGICPDDSAKMSEFINSFNIPFKSLKKLKFLRKSIKFNSLTNGDLVGIISRGINNPDLEVTGYLMADISKSLIDDDYDMTTINQEKSRILE